MKKSAFFGFVGLLAILVGGGLTYRLGADEKADPNPQRETQKSFSSAGTHRFAIISGDYETVGSDIEKRQSVFRIDTKSGKTWIYRHEFRGGKYLSYWETIYE